MGGFGGYSKILNSDLIDLLRQLMETHPHRRQFPEFGEGESLLVAGFFFQDGSGQVGWGV